MPPSYRALRWAVAGTVWTGLGGATVALFATNHGFLLFGKALAALVAGGYYAGDRAARVALARRLGKLARGDVDLSRLKHEADGELVHVRGRVQAKTALGGVFQDERKVVYGRMRFALDMLQVVHEAACDFSLVDDSGERVLLSVDGARLVAPEPKKQTIGSDIESALFALPLPPRARKLVDARRLRVGRGKKVKPISGWEFLLRDGDEVEVVGYKTRVVDVSVADRLERDTPLRATLRSGKELPLIIAPARPRDDASGSTPSLPPRS